MGAFTYMGTKRALAETIAAASLNLPTGPFLDLFSGVSAVGSAIAPKRHIWCNDVQRFSAQLTRALYLSEVDEVAAEDIATATKPHMQRHLDALRNSLTAELNLERETVAGGDPTTIISAQAEIGKLAGERASDLRKIHTHCLFSTTYSGTYFGLSQATEIDAIRAGLDEALIVGAVTTEQHRWGIVALCRAVAAVSNSTGHFAQYLTPKPSNLHRVIAKRRRSAAAEWNAAIRYFTPISTAAWRVGNRVFTDDANAVLRNLVNAAEAPGIVYADPPYTDDQYSRFYHVLETVVLYDYPVVSGKGQYRPGRFTSSFSLSSKVEESITEMICSASALPSALMISYPSNGLLSSSTEVIPALLHEHFAKVHQPLAIAHAHSTMGGSKGAQKHLVTEHIYIAEQGRSAA